MTSIGTPTVAAVERLRRYGLEVDTVIILPNRVINPKKLSYQHLSSNRGITGLRYYPEVDRYGYQAATLKALAEEFKGPFIRAYNHEGGEADFDINHFIRHFEYACTLMDRQRAYDLRDLATAFALYSNTDNRRFTSNLGYEYTTSSHHTLGDCYRLAAEAFTDTEWARLMEVWNKRLPVDVLTEIARGGNIHLLTAFETPEKKSFWVE